MNSANIAGRRFGLLLTFFLALLMAGCSKPAMPVTVSFRTAALDSSLVAQFHNNSNRYLSIVLKFENKTLNQEKTGFITIGPLATEEIGWAEGWKFMSGEYVTVSHEDYSTVQVRVP